MVFEHAEEQLSKLQSTGRWTQTMVEPLLDALARTGDTLGAPELPLGAPELRWGARSSQLRGLITANSRSAAT